MVTVLEGIRLSVDPAAVGPGTSMRTMTVPNSASRAPANENWPPVKLRSVGDGLALAKVIVRVLVRRALISDGILVGDSCENRSRAG